MKRQSFKFNQKINSWNDIQLETWTQFRYFKLTNCINVSVAFVLGQYVRTYFSILVLMITSKEYSAVTGFLYFAIIPTRWQICYRIINFWNISFFSRDLLVLQQITFSWFCLLCEIQLFCCLVTLWVIQGLSSHLLEDLTIKDFWFGQSAGIQCMYLLFRGKKILFLGKIGFRLYSWYGCQS